MKQAETHNLFRLLVRAAALVAVAGTVSCSRELPSGESQGEGIRLEFIATVDDGFGPAPASAQWAASTATQGATQPATRGPIFGANFPAGTYLISLGIFKDEYENWAWDTGYDNIKAEVTVDAYGAQKWRFQLKDSTTWMDHLTFPENTATTMWITALYPYDAAATVSLFGPGLESTHDFTTPEQQANQTDAMFSWLQKLTLVPGDRSRALLLKFEHCFTMFEFQIAPMFDTPSRISKVGMTYTREYGGLSQKVSLSTQVGAGQSGGGLGEVAITDTRPMAMGTYNTYRIMIAPVSSTIQPGELAATFTDDANPFLEPFSLEINPEWLNGGKFSAGERYIIKMLYNNAATGPGSLTVTDWAVGGEVTDMWGTPTPTQGYLCWGAQGLVTSGLFESGKIPYTITGSTRNSYNGYDNTQANAAGNGSAINWDKEPPYYRLEVDKTDMTGTWDEAWDKCKQKAPAGQWRLPRESELMLMYLNRGQLLRSSGFAAFDTASSLTYYWCGSENYIPSSNTYTSKLICFQDGSIRQGSKAESRPARCVREMP